MKILVSDNLILMSLTLMFIIIVIFCVTMIATLANYNATIKSIEKKVNEIAQCQELVEKTIYQDILKIINSLKT